MRTKWNLEDERYFGIGVYKPKNQENIGTLWRTALILKASFIFVVDARYKKNSSDILKVWSKIPLFQFETTEAFLSTIPYSCQIIGVEMSTKAEPIKEFTHPERAIYLLGSEDHGLPNAIQAKCHKTIYLPGEQSLNVAVAGSIVLYDRINKMEE